MTAKFLPETDVLTPRDPTITNSDDWPEFKLKDAEVTLPDGALHEHVSLLLASETHPLTVRGRLEAVPDDLAHTFRLPARSRTASIEVTEVRSFAYGAYADGSSEVWAAGKAGWYVIKPSKAYRKTFNEMIDAVNMLFFIADAYQTPRKSGKGKNAVTLPDYNAQELFEKYAIEVMGIEKAAPEAAEKMYKHRDFLLSSMIAGKEGMTWRSNPLYKHLTRKFSEDWSKIKQRLAKPVQGPEAASARARKVSKDSASTTSSLKRKRGRPPRQPAADVISIGSSSVASSAVKEDSKKAAAKATTTSDANDATRPKAPHTQRTRRDSELAALSTPTESSQAATPAQDSDSDAGLSRARKGKSALRLKPSKPTKGPPKSATPPMEEEDEDDQLTWSSPVPTKRQREDAKHQAKPRRRGSRHVDEGIDIPTSPSADEEVPATPSDDAMAGAADLDLAVRLRHEPDPVQEDTWICALDGCTHKVYSASLPESQRLIREHYALHAYDDDARVQLVNKLKAPSLPINHLMEKVRMQAKLDGFPGSIVAGTRYPQPIQQRY